MKPIIRKIGFILSCIVIGGNLAGYIGTLLSGKYLFDGGVLFSYFVYGIGLTVGLYGYMIFTQEDRNVETTPKD